MADMLHLSVPYGYQFRSMQVAFPEGVYGSVFVDLRRAVVDRKAFGKADLLPFRERASGGGFGLPMDVDAVQDFAETVVEALPAVVFLQLIAEGRGQ